MLEYIRQWQFWFAVIVVSLIVNYFWNRFTGKGKLT